MIDILKALADETRLRIIGQLINGDLCVCEIEACLHLTQSNASRHLTVLKKAGIVESFKEAQWVYYKISNTFINDNKDLFCYLQKELKNMPTYKKDTGIFNECKQQDICNSKKYCRGSKRKGDLNE